MPFLRLTDPAALPHHLKGAVIAIGNFDGVHRGHQAVLQHALHAARRAGKPALVLTFEPHPRSLMQPDKPVDRLTPAGQKAEIFRLMGFDAVLEQTFSHAFAACSAEAFVEDILYGLLQISGVVTGYNCYFGHKRRGSPAFLQQAGQKLGFDVHVIDALHDESGQVISSSRIRALLAQGKVAQAAALLGYHYTVSAKVIHGAALGRTLGFPTANMLLTPQTSLALGIYAVRLRDAGGKIHDGVASFGRRPTVNTVSDPLLETYIFDFSGDLYEQACSVAFFSFLRGEMTFDGLEPLMAQMRRDAADARAALAGIAPLSALDRHFTFESWH